MRSQLRKLQELDQRKSHFFANVSHELRTALTLVKFSLRDLNQTFDGGQRPERKRFDLALSNAERLERLFDQLLDLSRLEAGFSPPVRFRVLDAAALARRIVDSFQGVAIQRSIALEAIVPAGRSLLCGDEDKLARVLINLLSNAMKFTLDGGSVSVVLEDSSPGTPTRGAITIRVSDTGIGIPEEAMPHIFERFYQVHPHGEPGTTQGTGIGLALAKELIELHGGQIFADSEPGVGSTFGFTLSKQADASNLRSANASKGVSSRGLISAVRSGSTRSGARAETDDCNGQPTLLVVEDNFDVRSYLTRSLDGLGRIIEAADGAAGLEMAQKHQPDIILSNVMMPSMDGIEFCRRVKRDIRLNATPFILISAKNWEDARLAGLEAGAHDYVSKPFSMPELKARVRNHLDPICRTQALPGCAHLTDCDDAFLRKLRAATEAHLADSAFTVEDLAAAMATSRRQLQRRVRETTGQSPLRYVRTLRLEAADVMLKNGGHATIAQVAAAVGLSAGNFSRLYRRHFRAATVCAMTMRRNQPLMR